MKLARREVLAIFLRLMVRAAQLTTSLVKGGGHGAAAVLVALCISTLLDNPYKYPSSLNKGHFAKNIGYRECALAFHIEVYS